MNAATRRWFRRFYQHGIIKYGKWHPTKPYQISSRYEFNGMEHKWSTTVHPLGPYWNEYHWFPLEKDRIYPKPQKNFYQHHPRKEKEKRGRY